MVCNKNIYLNYVITIFLLLVINLIFINVAKYEIFGWYLLSINLSGIIIIYELVKYVRGSYDLFEPRGLIALLGTHYFFISPLLFLAFGREMLYVENPDDWGGWVGFLALLNFIGLLVYKSIFFYFNNVIFRPLKRKWVLDANKFKFYFVIFFSLAFVAQSYFFFKQGGISGLVQSKTSGTLNLSGFGWLLMIGESLPLITFFGVYYFFFQNKGKERSKKSTILVFTILILFFLFQFVIAGLRGSRSATVFVVFWVVVIIHYNIKPFKRIHLFFGILFIALFMVGYGYYKNVGSDVTRVLTSESSFDELQEGNENRGLLNTLTGDLSRVSTQAYLLYRLCHYGDEYDLGFGRTYIGDLSILVPSFILNDPPPTKIKEGTELMYGKGSYIPGQVESSRVYGILGEGLLNFHLIAVPIVFIVWSLFVLFVSRLVKVLPKGDSRWLILPLLIQLTFTSVNSDLDNITFGLVKNGAIPFLLIYLSSYKKVIKE